MTETPVAFIIFNRPESTKLVFERIASAKPRKLLLIGDGAREERVGELLLCREVREIAQNVTWPCEVSTNFAATNLGCRERVVSGLDWVFSMVEEAIILEDDCLPDLSFFRFCEELLARYRNDTRVGMINGNNFTALHKDCGYSYYFSRLAHIWGWATWRSTWQQYDGNMNRWPTIRRDGVLRDLFARRSEARYWTEVFEAMYNGTGPDTWDIQMAYSILINNLLCAVPHVNMVQNIGFGPDATHTVTGTAPDSVTKAHHLNFPIRHPSAMVPLRSFDEFEHSILNQPNLRIRLNRKLRFLFAQSFGKAQKRNRGCTVTAPGKND